MQHTRLPDLRAPRYGVRDARSRSYLVLASGEPTSSPPQCAGRRLRLRDPLESLAAHLARFTGPAPTDWVFTGDKGGPQREAVWQHEWAKARAALGLPGLHFHDLRHAAATMAAATGAGVKEIMYRIGHSSPQAALRYSTPARRDLAIAAGIDELNRQERGTVRPESPNP